MCVGQAPLCAHHSWGLFVLPAPLLCQELVSINIPRLKASKLLLLCVSRRRFAKNLSPDKINLSTLKGEGQLTNLELDEEVLQSLLDIPTWLAINRVECNKAAIRVRDTF